MTTRFPLLAVFAAAVLFGSTAFAQSSPPANKLPSVQLPPELDRVLRDYEKAWTQNKPADLAALFTEDGMALSNEGQPARGAAEVIAEYKDAAGSPLSLRAVAFAISQDIAYIIGGFGVTAEKPDLGKFVLVLRRGADGRWKIAADIDNLNFRPKAAATPVQSPAPTATPRP